MGRERYASLARILMIAVLGFAVAACSSDSNNSSSDDLLGNFTVSGSIGDGPIVGAEITVRDANGEIVTRSVSNAMATYSINLPGSTALPVTVHVVGGTDLVTQRAADFEMTALINEIGEQTVNVSPLTTLVTEAAQCAGDTGDVKLDQLWQAVERDLNIGLDTTVWANPMTDPVTADNAETAVIGNEAVGEWIRRTASSLLTANVSMADIVQAMACDLGDGAMDGVLVSPVAEVSAQDAQRTLAVAKAVEAGIRLEVLAGRLEVDGTDATQAMNDAVRVIMPQLTAADVNRVPVTQAALQKAIEVLTVLTGVVDDSELAELIAALQNASTATAAAVIEAALDANAQITVQGLPTRIGLADDVDVVAINERTGGQNQASRPIVALGATPDSISSGNTSLLSWSATNADGCVSDWSDDLVSEGTWRTPALTSSTRYQLTCYGLGGATSAYVDVTVDNQPLPEPEPEPEPQPEPQPDPEPDPQPNPQPEPEPGQIPNVSLTISNSTVSVGDMVTLNWTSSGADSCQGSGSWSGSKNFTGSQNMSNITSNRTYTLSCTNAAGTARSTVGVAVLGQIVLNWLAPTEYDDGSQIQALSAYRFHYGTSPGEYDDVVEVDGSLTSYTFNLPAGAYYFAMTSVDQDNVESKLSAEVQLQAQ